MTNRLIILLVLGQSLNIAGMQMESPMPERQHARCMHINPTMNMGPSHSKAVKRKETTPIEFQTPKKSKMGRPTTPKSKENLIPEFELGAAHGQTPDEPICLPVTPPAKSPVQLTAGATLPSNQT